MWGPGRLFNPLPGHLVAAAPQQVPPAQSSSARGGAVAEQICAPARGETPG